MKAHLKERPDKTFVFNMVFDMSMTDTPNLGQSFMKKH